MRNTIKSTLYGFLFSVGLFVSACSGSGDSDLVDVIDSDSGDALVSDEYSPIRITDRGVAPSKNAAELVDAGELDAGDAAELLDVGELDANDGGDASVDAAELLDAGELDATTAPASWSTTAPASWSTTAPASWSTPATAVTLSELGTLTLHPISTVSVSIPGSCSTLPLNLVAPQISRSRSI